MKSLIVLVIDHDTAAQDHHDGAPLTADVLYEQGGFVNEDAAGMYGYEGWMTIFDAPDDIVKKLGELNYKPRETGN